MAKIMITYGVPMEGFGALSGHEVIAPPTGAVFTRAELLALLPGTEAVLACKGFDRELMEAAPSLRIIVCYGAGYDTIDVHAATERGVMVANTPDCVTAPTAELAIAHIMAQARRLVEFDTLSRTMPAAELFRMGMRMGTSLEGATLGIVGMGRIGGRVADFGRVMGMRVLYAARHAKPERDALGDRQVTLEQLMTDADFISIHCPQTPETTGLISREMLARMKPSAFLINTARGPVVNEAALLDALREKRIGGAGLDVYDGEPNVNPAFFELKNVLLTPHVGSNTARAREQMALAASQRILDALAGKAPQNWLNPEARV
ncbi:MAG: NAD(P)-dependent oxidoreductase [Clostridia bacterium]